MLVSLAVKFLLMIILCCLIHNGQCADDPSHATPQRSVAMSAAVAPTLGQRVLEEQIRLLQRANFTELLGAEAVDSWGVNWEILADQGLPFDDPRKRNNLRIISDRLRDINFSEGPIRTDTRFIAMRGSVDTLRVDIQGVHAKRLEELTRSYFPSPAFPLRGATVTRYVPKSAGDQLGGIATVIFPGDHEVKYYVKTHAGGHLSSRSAAAKPVNPVELMVYKVLALSGFGCEVHFFQRSLEDVYVATLDAAVEPSTWQSGQFLTFEQYSKPASAEARAMADRLRSLWENLEAIPIPCSDADKPAIEARIAGDPQAQNFIGQIAALDILSRVLRLTDVFNNSDNFGFVVHDAALPRLKAIDFRVLGERDFDFTYDHFRGFLVGNGQFMYYALHKLLSYALHYRAVESRSQTARQVLSVTGSLGNLRDTIVQAHDEIARYIAQPDFAVNLIELRRILDHYRDTILRNLACFNATLNHDGAHDKAQCFECERVRKLLEPVKV